MMTIDQVLARAEQICPADEIDRNIKISWLSQADGQIFLFMNEFENAEVKNFEGYKEYTPGDTELLVGSPYDDLYIYLLLSHVDRVRGEYERYENDVEAYNRILSDYRRWYAREHEHRQPAYRWR